MKYEPNIVETSCLKCQRQHWTFIERIDEKFFNICENCLSPKERLEMVKVVRRVLSVKYGNDINKITNIVENQQTTEEPVAESPKIEETLPSQEESPKEEELPKEEPPAETQSA